MQCQTTIMIMCSAVARHLKQYTESLEDESLETLSEGVIRLIDDNLGLRHFC